MGAAARTLLLVLAPFAASTLVLAQGVNLNSPTGTAGLIMVDKVGGQVRFFDPGTDRELAAFAPDPQRGLKAHELAISPDHKNAYVTVYGDGVYGNNPHPGNTVAIVDLVARRMVGSIDVAPYEAPHGIQVDASGTLYVACDLSRKVLVLDPAKRRLVAAIDVEGAGHWIALLPDGSKLYVANKNDKPFVSVVDVKARKMIGRIPVPHGPQGIVASPDGASDLHAPQQVVKSGGTGLMGFAFAADGKTVLVGNHGQGTVSRIDLETAAVIKTFPAGKGVETLAYF
jgi:YVTN family beta-propeller protein